MPSTSFSIIQESQQSQIEITGLKELNKINEGKLATYEAEMQKLRSDLNLLEQSREKEKAHMVKTLQVPHVVFTGCIFFIFVEEEIILKKIYHIHLLWRRLQCLRLID